MLFDFLRRLFGKADEGNKKIVDESKKRKASIDESNFGKKFCHDTESDKYVNIINESKDNCVNKCLQLNSNSNNSSFNSKHCHSSVANGKKFDLLQTSLHWPTSMKPNFIGENGCASRTDCSMLQKCDSLSHFTLNQTNKLNEKRQYSEMLLNFVSPESHIGDKETGKSRNLEYSMKIINLNKSKSLFSNAIDSNRTPPIIKRINRKPCYLGTSNSTQAECEKCVIDISEDTEDEQKDNNAKPLTRSVPIEVIKTNTLKEKLANRQVTRQDYVSQIDKMYDKRAEPRAKEVEELRKVATILSKHNQLTREATLEERLKQSMRLHEAIIDDREEEEEAELPELTHDMLNKVKYALSAGPGDEILVQEFGLRITRKDIQTLAGLNWLNDEVINFYMNLLIQRGNQEKYPSVYAMNTFFYPKLLSGGHSSLKRWTRKVDIFAKDLVVVPIHLGIHWCMSIIDFRSKSIQYFDSMGKANYKCLQALKQYLHDESMDKKKRPFDFNDWNLESMQDIPQQMNGSDCGVFSCMFAEYICANRSINFSQDNMPYFRSKMVYEILTVQLL